MANRFIVAFSVLTNKQKIVVSTIVVAAIVLLILSFLVFGGTAAPDPKMANSKDITNYLASDTFGDLSSEKKQAYMETLRSRSDFKGPPKNVSRDQMDKIRRNMRGAMRDRMSEDMKKFETLSDAEKTAFLDEKIDEMQARHQEAPPPGEAGGPAEAGGPGGPGGPGGNGPPGSGGAAGRDRLRGMLSHSDPKERASRMKFMDEMRKRMQERGIEMPQGGPGGGGPPP